MLDFWNNLSYTTKFSAIAFVSTFVLGFISMGMLGALLYYPVAILFRSYPGIDYWHGDWVWPAVIMVGLGWSFGFLIAGLAWHYLDGAISSVWLLRFIYGAILWAWAAFLWYWILRSQF
ncbi:MAG: hypothetical protein AB8H12_02545 [Lewinella sp.]